MMGKDALARAALILLLLGSGLTAMLPAQPAVLALGDRVVLAEMFTSTG